MSRQSIEDIRKAELIEAALVVVAQEGHDAATTQKIAAEADISAGIVHHYFGDKARLLCAAMRAVRQPVAAAYRQGLLASVQLDGAQPDNAQHDGAQPDGSGEKALDICIDAHLNPSILTVHRAAAWLQFTSRVAYQPDYARIQAAVRCRQLAALRRALLPLTRDRRAAERLSLRLAVMLDGFWTECATREGGLIQGEARAAVDQMLGRSDASDSIW